LEFFDGDEVGYGGFAVDFDAFLLRVGIEVENICIFKTTFF